MTISERLENKKTDSRGPDPRVHRDAARTNPQFGDTPGEESFGREALMRYFKDALIGAFPSNPKTVPPTLKYFLEIVDILKNMKAENLTSKSILTGSPQNIIDDLKAVEAAGISEVILYFNYGLKPNAMVIEQMNRFMDEIAPRFAHPAETARAAD